MIGLEKPYSCICCFFSRFFRVRDKKKKKRKSLFRGVGREEGRGNEDCKRVRWLSAESGVSQFVFLLK